MEEQWKAVVGFEGLYEVSDLGRVRSLDRVVDTPQGSASIRGVMLRLHNPGNGYRQVGLSSAGKVRRASVHRLVLKAFTGDPPEDRPHVNHINFDRDDNRLVNLEYCSPTENMKHSSASGRLGALTNPKKSTKYSKATILEALGLVREGVTLLSDIDAKFGFHRGYAASLRAGRTWTSPCSDRPKLSEIARDRLHSHKVSVEEADDIRGRVASGEMQKSVAEDLGLSKALISKIVNFKRLMDIT